MSKSKKIIILSAVVICAVSAVVAFFILRGDGNRLVLYGNVDIRTVNLGFRVGGRLAELFVDEGDVVGAGQRLGRLDDAPYRIALDEAKANAAAQKAQAALMESGYRDEEIAQARSELDGRQAAYDYARSFHRRQQEAWKTRSVSADDVENAKTSMDQADASLQAAREKLSQLETGYRIQEIEAARAKLMQAEAALEQASLDLDDTVLVTPSAGTVMTRAVEPGTMLTAGATVLTVSLTRPVWVRAYVDEVNLARTAPGTKVSMHIDGGDRARVYTGKIGFVSPTAEFTPKTVQTPELRTDLVYRLRIIVEDPDDALRQGMPISIELDY